MNSLEDGERPKTPPPEDIPLKEIIPKLNEEQKINPIKGILLVGYPYSEDQINALKLYNINIDKFVVLNDEKNRSLLNK